MGWKDWKKGFEAWESNAASYAESVLRSPLLLNPLGSVLTAAFHGKAGMDQRLGQLWSTLGLPTRESQERLLHAVNQLESRLLDLEERIVDLAAARADDGAAPRVVPAADAAPAPAATPTSRKAGARPRAPRAKEKKAPRPAASAAAPAVPAPKEPSLFATAPDGAALAKASKAKRPARKKPAAPPRDGEGA